jgi:hypothetical protein
MDAWIVNLANGATKVEEWVPGQLSPWQRVRRTIGDRTVACKSNAAGYWQAHGMPSVQGMECDEDLHKWRGIGYVEDGTVFIIWGARDPISHNVVFWQDARSASNQAQIIWSSPSLLVGSQEIMTGDAEVRNLKEFQDKMVQGTA